MGIHVYIHMSTGRASFINFMQDVIYIHYFLRVQNSNLSKPFALDSPHPDEIY